MPPAELADRVAAVLGVSVEVSYGEAVGRVPAEHWVGSVRAVRDDVALDLVLFDLLCGVDQDPGPLEVVLRLWSPQRRHGLRLVAQCDRERPRLASLTPVFAGADWHEREAHEMFGIEFEGHPHLVPLLLPDGFVGRPLRKDFALTSRAVRPWPGVKEPGQGPGDPPPRRPARPYGVGGT